MGERDYEDMGGRDYEGGCRIVVDGKGEVR